MNSLILLLRDPAFRPEVSVRRLINQAADHITALEVLVRQYRDDLRYPPQPDSIVRRIAAIDAALAKDLGADVPKGFLTSEPNEDGYLLAALVKAVVAAERVLPSKDEPEWVAAARAAIAKARGQ